ncbi:ionotropic receptor 75a-like [Chrysoperla carnea]|uniref:ionotropic receptor 75a-like n=1 Tax=Chrysoperla carnea TaxID=189513 RepID=UPI001D08E2DD|nr:ionotropic receptor 75a-like [Chrysoperla carnea]
MNELESTGRRRRNLHRILFQCSSVIQFPQLFTYMSDIRKRSVDPFSKWTFPLAKLLSQDLNFTYNWSMVDNFGWDINGTGIFDGFVGMLQRQEKDFGMGGILMRLDRIPVIDFTAETIPVKSRLIFRKPSLSSISNIFVLPFDLKVWISSLALCFLIGVFIFFQLWLQNRISTLQPNVSKLTDIVTFISGAMCQQGSTLNPHSLSLRITFFLVFMAGVFLFTSYSANIVALLQTPSNSIKTLNDLINSPIVVGVHNITYNHVFLKESKSPLTKRLYEKKILPRGVKGFIEPDEGLKLVQQGMYAFQVDSGFAYEYMSAKYREQEKCGLDEIEAYQLPLQSVPVRKHFPYRDLFTQRLRWQKEIGLIDRTRRRLVPQKPKCESSRADFVSVGLTEFMPAIRVLSYGIESLNPSDLLPFVPQSFLTLCCEHMFTCENTLIHMKE